MTTKIRKSSDKRVSEFVSKAFDLAPDMSQARMLLGDAYRGILLWNTSKRGWADKRLIETLEGVRISPMISAECADQINQALEILRS